MWDIRTVDNEHVLRTIIHRLGLRPYYEPLYVMSRHTEDVLIEYLNILVPSLSSPPLSPYLMATQPYDHIIGKWVKYYGKVDLSTNPEAMLNAPYASHMTMHMIVLEKDLATSQVLNRMFKVCKLNVKLELIVISNKLAMELEGCNWKLYRDMPN